MLKILSKFPKKEKRITVATVLTLLRLVFIPFLVYSMINQEWTKSFWIFIVASLSDFLDGGIARFRNEQTMLGAALDPFVDKFLILSVYFTLAFIDTPLFSIPKWFFILVFSKEILLILGSLFLLKKDGPFNVKPTYLGKGAMLIQVAFITWLFSCYFFNWVPVKTYYLMLFLVLFFVGGSLIQYFYLGFKKLCSSS